MKSYKINNFYNFKIFKQFKGLEYLSNLEKVIIRIAFFSCKMKIGWRVVS